jgi:uncharacterized protein (DUF1697 family)
VAELRAVAVKNGLRSPETYIQSGNLIIDADVAADEVGALLEQVIAKRFWSARRRHRSRGVAMASLRGRQRILHR